MKMILFAALGMIAVISLGYILTVGLVWLIFYLIYIMAGVAITWNIWIAGLIVYIIMFLIK